MSTQTAYRIRHWGNGMFEHRSSNGRSNAALPWVAVPTKHDGKGFLRLAAKDQDGAIYGCWVLILAVAAKCPIRGLLADEDEPLSIEDVALKTHRSVDAMRSSFEALMSPDIGWVERVPFDLDTHRAQLARSLPATGAPTGRDGTVRNVTDGTDVTSRSAPVPDNRQASELEGSPAGPKGSDSRKHIPEIFRPITDATLSDTESLDDWISWQASQPKPAFKPRESSLKDVLGYAEVAIERGDNPVAYFVFMLQQGRKFSELKKPVRDRALARLEEYRRSQ